MGETSSQKTGKRHERVFLLCAVLAAALCVALAFWYAPPKAKPDPAPQTPLLQSLRVDLNTADFETLCILPGVGEKRAQAILDYREAHGPFRRVEDAAAVPGLTEDLVASWAELAYVSWTNPEKGE